jgi:hypothetical protein
MRRYISLLLFIGLAFWSCEEEPEPDTTPPTVSIQSPITNQSINEIVTIVVETNDNEGISKVEFYIDDSLFFTDLESPYQYDWNTTQYEDNSEHIVKVVSYDNSDNSTTSQPIMLTVDNSTSYPNGVNVSSVTYTLTEMTIRWELSTDGDFKDYKVLYSETESGDRDTIFTYTDNSVTSHTISEFDPTNENWFWVLVTDTMGLSSIGGGMTNVLDSPPITPIIDSIYFIGDGIAIDWVQSQDNDFSNYSIQYSHTASFDSFEILYTSNNQSDDNYFYRCDTNTNYYAFDFVAFVPAYYRLITTDVWGQESLSNISTIEFEYPNLTISAPDTIHRPSDATVSLHLISAEIIDSFDNETVSFVGFTRYHVEGDSMMNNGNYLFLYDDGSEVVLFEPDFTSGDATKGDGIYSFRIPIYGTGFTDPSFQTIAGHFIWYFTVQYHCLAIEPFTHTIVIE